MAYPIITFVFALGMGFLAWKVNTVPVSESKDRPPTIAEDMLVEEESSESDAESTETDGSEETEPTE